MGSVPPGTRKSTYDNPDYLKGGAVRADRLESDHVGRPDPPTKDPVPYTGVQFVAIPEFQGIGTTVGQNIAAACRSERSPPRWKSRRRPSPRP